MRDSYLSIAKDFTITPGGRKKIEGKFSGEEFREKFLEPKVRKAIKNRDKLICDLDGCLGYPSSFLDESFGVLGRKLCKEEHINIFDYIELQCEDEPSLIESIRMYVQG